MHAERHSTVQEGVVTGLLGAVAVAIWYFLIDVIQARAFYTPNVLGQVFLGGDTDPTIGRIIPAAVGGYTVLHVAAFAVVGIAATALVHLAIRRWSWRMGVWFALIIGVGLFNGLMLMLGVATDRQFPWFSVVTGNLIAVVVMGLFLWRRHPALRRSLATEPLGDQIEAPPAPRR